MNIGELRRRFRRSLNHTPQPVPFISELFNAKVKVDDSPSYVNIPEYGVDEALTLQPLPHIRISSSHVKVEGKKKVRVIPPDDLSFLCLYSHLVHELIHVRQVYSPEGFRIYESLESFINETKKGRNFRFNIEYEKLELSPTIAQYIFLRFPEFHLGRFSIHGDDTSRELARIVERYGEELGHVFREEALRNDDHKKALEYERYLSFFEGSAFKKYAELLNRLIPFTFSNKNFSFFLRLRIKGYKDYRDCMKEHPESLGIDLGLIKNGLRRLRCIGGATRDRADYLLKFLPESDNLLDFLKRLRDFAISVPVIIYDEKKKKTYAHNYKISGRVWLGYYIDLSIAFQIRRARLIRERDDPRSQVRCPFSGSEQFQKCEGCYGLLYPEIDFRGCKFLREWKRSEALNVLG